MFGICKLSLVPVRSNPSDKAEIVTQLIFGDIYSVTENLDDKWLKIRIQYDNYEGWIDLKQHHAVSENYFLDYLNVQHPVVTDLVHFVNNELQIFPVLLGSTLPFLQYNTVNFEGEKLQFHGNYSVNKRNPDTELLEQTAIRYFNAPYLWGGKSLFGTDCSGFIQQVFKVSGYKLLRDAYQQAEQGAEIPALVHAQKGDLCFFRNDEGRVIHVGMILEGNTIIHASGQVRIDVITEDGIINNSTGVLSHKLCKITRII